MKIKIKKPLIDQRLALIESLLIKGPNGRSKVIKNLDISNIIPSLKMKIKLPGRYQINFHSSLKLSEQK